MILYVSFRDQYIIHCVAGGFYAQLPFFLLPSRCNECLRLASTGGCALTPRPSAAGIDWWAQPNAHFGQLCTLFTPLFTS